MMRALLQNPADLFTGNPNTAPYGNANGYITGTAPSTVWVPTLSALVVICKFKGILSGLPHTGSEMSSRQRWLGFSQTTDMLSGPTKHRTNLLRCLLRSLWVRCRWHHCYGHSCYWEFLRYVQ
jgi:hypothetical protein